MNRRQRKKNQNYSREPVFFGRLDPQEHVKTRKLWERVFPDTEDFLDYYYTQCTSKNLIYAAKNRVGEAISMVQLNPYQVHLKDDIAQVHYIVGVATLEEFRHQGIMSRLLGMALNESFEKQEPFLFLMPAAEAIYLPFDFRTVYHQKQTEITLCDENTLLRAAEIGEICIRPAKQEDAGTLAEFSERMLSENYHLYTKRTADYFLKMMLETESEHGCVLMFTREEDVIGYCFLGAEEMVEVFELVTEKSFGEEALRVLKQFIIEFRPQTSSFKLSAFPEELELDHVSEIPLIMTRIVHLETFAGFLRASSLVSFWLRVKDEMIPKNQGLYHFEIGKDSARARKHEYAEEGAEVIEVEAWELSEIFFEGKYRNGMKGTKLYPLKNIFLNEVV